ncbi:MAG: flagellar protein FlgN [Gammaproteobacteria bacterium]|nr:MAG: flagellar protein FlgN [Gammaproteobacteria bacterium]
MAMTSSQQLQKVLQAEQYTASQLLEILTAEREALMKSESDVIEKMTANKHPLTVQLEQLGRQREAILQAEGFSADKDGLEAFIANQNDVVAQQLQSLLKQLRETAYACRDNNQINGGIVNVNRQYLHRAMSVLRGRDMNITSYGPGGEYTSQVVRQPLIGRV